MSTTLKYGFPILVLLLTTLRKSQYNFSHCIYKVAIVLLA